MDRYSIISYGYVLHYWFYSLILFAMFKLGCFKKMNDDRYYEFTTQSENVDCHRGLEIWFASYVFFCPIASVISFYCMCLAKYNYNIRAYSIETWNRQYQVYSNFDNRINLPILTIDIFNIVWAILGNILDFFLENTSTSHGAIRDCTRDYGISTNLMAHVFILLSYVQILRFALYYGVLIHHRKTLGYLESRYRKDINPRQQANDREV